MFSRISNLLIVCIILVAIGGVQQVAAVEMEAGTWTQKADMPTARYIAGSAVVDGKIYVIGGAPVPYGHTAVVEEYDPATDAWTRRADMPTARQGLCAAAVDGIIYAIGGWKPGGDSSTVEAYDPATDKWSRMADMPTRRTLMPAVVVDGIIYVIGGELGITPLSVVEAYNPATDKWTRKANMPTARRMAAACVVDGRIYVFGGIATWDDPNVILLPTVEVYDPATDTWTQASDMPWRRNHHAASVVDGKMYIFGGVSASPEYEYLNAEEDEDAVFMSPIVDVYDPATDTWTTAADFPNPRWDYVTNVVDGKIYAIGGRLGEPDEYPNLSPVSTVYEYAPGLPGALSSVSPGGKLLETWGQVKKVQ
jgi:N-acetylneuraminic acid mutarotase